MSATVGIDIGGTFTDVVLMADDGSLLTTKAPTTPDRLFDGLLQALGQVAELSGITRDQLLETVGRIAHGTTAATNAYIERRGARVALLTTRGFEDTLFMQRMLGMTAGLTASELTDYSLRQVPEPLVERAFVFGVRERIDYRGDVIGPLQEDDVRSAASAIRDADIDAIAVSYLWSFKNHDHERRTAEILREELPDIYLSISSELVPRLGEYERTATTVINAYLGPLVKNYTDVLERQFGTTGRPLGFGGWSHDAWRSGQSANSAALVGTGGGRHGIDLPGRHPRTPECHHLRHGRNLDRRLADRRRPGRRARRGGRRQIPPAAADDRHSAIGAGGGSIARVEDGGYSVSGRRARAPFPALPATAAAARCRPSPTPISCSASSTPRTSSAAGSPRRRGRAQRDRGTRRASRLSRRGRRGRHPGVADSRMADLLRTHDDRAGARSGGVRALRVRRRRRDSCSGVRPRCCERGRDTGTQSVHCAFGAIASDVTLKSELSAPMRITRDSAGADVDPAQLEEIFSGLEERARAALLSQGVATDEQDLSRIVEVRFTRQTKTLSVPYPGSVPQFGSRFPDRLWQALRGGFRARAVRLRTRHLRRGRPRNARRPSLTRYPLEGSDASQALLGKRRVHDPVAREFTNMPLYDGERLRPGNTLTGPAIVEYEGTTVALPSGQRANVDELLNIVIRREG